MLQWQSSSSCGLQVCLFFCVSQSQVGVLISCCGIKDCRMWYYVLVLYYVDKWCTVVSWLLFIALLLLHTQFLYLQFVVPAEFHVLFIFLNLFSVMLVTRSMTVGSCSWLKSTKLRSQVLQVTRQLDLRVRWKVGSWLRGLNCVLIATDIWILTCIIRILNLVCVNIWC